MIPIPPAGPVAILGSGIDAAGWAARLVLNGIAVQVWDPSSDCAERIASVVEAADSAFGALTLAPLPERGALTISAELPEALDGAVWALACPSATPEADISRMQDVEATLPRTTPFMVTVPTGSMSSRPWTYPARVLFVSARTPVYVIPLAELWGTTGTDPAVISGMAELLAQLGMHPLIHKALSGAVAARLSNALRAEADRIVAEGAASYDDVAATLRFGPALEWVVSGMVASDNGADDQGNLPDHAIASVLQGLKVSGQGAGAVLQAFEDRLYTRVQDRMKSIADDFTKPLVLYRTRIRPDWVDYNGHLTESRYLQIFGNANDAFLAFIGVDDAYLANGRSVFTVETHIRHLREVNQGMVVAVGTRVLGKDDTRIRLLHEMRHGETNALLATGEHMLAGVDTVKGGAAPFADPLPLRLAAIEDGQAGLRWPRYAGRGIDAIAKGP